MNSRRSVSHLQAVQLEPVCPLCDGGVTTERKPLKFDYGADDTMVELAVDVPVHRCNVCDFEYLDDEAEHLKHDAVCQHLGVLSPTEIRQIREGMSRAQFARLTGIGEASLNRWENGLSIQTHAYDRYLRLLTRTANQHYLNFIVNPISIQTSGRFRVIDVTPRLQKEQENFQLRVVA